MSDERLLRSPARARPVADAPVEALLARAEELARRWAIALILARPPAEMATVPLEELAVVAPELCASIVNALCSEEELAQYDAGPIERDRGAREGAGAPAGLVLLADQWGPAASTLHFEALRGVLWEATLEELRDPSPRLLADLSDRLAFVCATVLADALAKPAPQVSGEADTAPREQILFSAPTSAPGQSAAVLIDELESAQEVQPPAAFHRREGDRASATPGNDDRRGADEVAADPRAASSDDEVIVRTAPRALPWDTPLEFSSGPPDEPARDEPSQAHGQEDPVMRLSRGRGAPPDRRR
ncbi:MAG TPA: hypothetical protein VGF47_08910 [Solirubrobacteraceae bacterium]